MLKCISFNIFIKLLALKVKLDNVREVIGYPQYILDDQDPRLDEKFRNVSVDEKKFFKTSERLSTNNGLINLRRFGTKVNELE